MSNTPTRSFALTTELDGYIRAQVASGLYGNASEVVRSALRLLIQHDQAMARGALDTGGKKPASLQRASR